jgi:lysophospholipase L1-like esterase
MADHLNRAAFFQTSHIEQDAPMSIRIALLRVLFVVLAVALPLAALEVALRVYGPFLPGRYSPHMYSAPHPLYGFARVPGMVGWVKSEEFLSRVAINAHGLREREIDYPKPAGTSRVLVLGDSFVEGVQVKPEETFTRALEATLRGRTGGQIEVINAGSGGWGTAQEFEFLRHEGLQYQPNVVALVFYTGNDVTDNSFRIKGNVRNLRKPYYALRDGKLELQAWTPRRPPSQAEIDALNRELYLWNVFETGVLARFQPPRDTANIDDLEEEILNTLVEHEIRVFSSSQNRAWQDSWDVTEALFVAARDAVEASGARFLLVNAPTVWQIYPAQWESFRAANKLRSDGWDLDVARRRLADLAARQGIEYLDLAPSLMAASASEPPLYFNRDMHWTAAGHRAVARALAERIEERFALALRH